LHVEMSADVSCREITASQDDGKVFIYAELEAIVAVPEAKICLDCNIKANSNHIVSQGA